VRLAKRVGIKKADRGRLGVARLLLFGNFSTGRFFAPLFELILA
jgi:hypothetical protein